ncbi:MAG: sodium:proton antiporter [Neisseriaceae bacterium]
MFRLLVLALFLLMSSPAWAVELDGRNFSLAWGLPFVLILLSVALMPILNRRFWIHHHGKIFLFWTLTLVIPFAYIYGISTVFNEVLDCLLLEYLPFIILITALYTVSGGILVWGTLEGKPRNNLLILTIGTFLASLMGTTGAAMLLIRPLLRANEKRKYRSHSVLFLIFLVANIGGGLTPIGDPPLFLGFLQGVDFFWTIEHMAAPVLLNTLLLLGAFYGLDRFLYQKELKTQGTGKAFTLVRKKEKIVLYGKFNLLLLLLIVVTVVFSGVWKSNGYWQIGHTQLSYESLIRDIILSFITLISLVKTPKPVRNGNEFNWEPILEVGKLFLAIFIAIIPVVIILKAGKEGALAGLVNLVTDTQGHPINSLYFWVSGTLSSLLDNAPTYLVFFNLASGGDAQFLMHEAPKTLLAISMGSVFMGALTYIGNAPNFMIKAIAEQRNVKLPGFFRYTIYAALILVPIFTLDMLIFLY